MSGKIELKEGLTWRSMLALILSSVMLLPVVLFINLVSGASGVAGAAVYIVIILFSQLSKIYNFPLTKQEVYVIYKTTAMAVSSTFFTNMVFRYYVMTSPLSWSFHDPRTDLPMPLTLPNWWAPTINSAAYSARSFLNADWIMPISVALTVQIGFSLVQEIALTFICALLYADVEPLPFPTAHVEASVITTLSERKPEKISILMLCSTIGMTYSAFLYGPFILTMGAMQTLPIPWFDLNFLIEKTFPGACLGFVTDLIPYAMGFIVPFWVVVQMCISSIMVWFFGNTLVLTVFNQYFPEWSQEWVPGMSLALTYQRSTIRVWIGPQISFSIVAAIIIVAKSYRQIIKSVKSLSRLSDLNRKAGYLSLRILLLMYVASATCYLIVFHYLVPDFPIWIPALLSLGWSFFYAILSTRAVGETGFSMNVPWLSYGSILLSGYKGFGPWLLSPMYSGFNTSNWTMSIKTAYLTETRPLDFFKAVLLATALSTIMGFIFVSFLWQIAPVPSSAYPNTVITWPIELMTNSMWWTGKIFVFKPIVMEVSFSLMLGIGVVGEIIARSFHAPFSIIGIVSGATILPATTIPMLIGALLGRFILMRFFGLDWWQSHRSDIVAGISIGEGVTIGILAAATMISKASWILPF